MFFSAVPYILLMCVLSIHGKVAFHDEIQNDILSDKRSKTTDNAIEVKVTTENINVLEIISPPPKSNVSTEEHVAFNATTDTNYIHSTVAVLIPKENKSITDNIIDTQDYDSYGSESKVDNGTALILTPYIEEGRINVAREASKVSHKLFFGLESYSGFLTVNKEHDSNLFFWYFPAENKPVNETPWIIWLQGGPGVSSLTGLFDEIGPFKVEMGTLKKNPFTWLQNHSLVFIDNPVGAGYSFTKHENGYANDMATYSKHLYVAFKQFLQLFPELRTAPLYIAGESYAGKYVPALGREIHRHQNVPGVDVNLQGFIIGNAYVDPEMITQVARPLYNYGLLDNDQVNLIKPLVDSLQAAVNASKGVEAKERWGELVSNILFMTHQKQMYNLLQDEMIAGKYSVFLKKSSVKRALHVGDIKFSFVNFTVNEQLAPDFVSSSKPIFEELLHHYKVLSYCGQLDLMIPCVVTDENHRKWRWNSSSEFLKASRHPYYYNRKLSGYYKSGGGFTEVLIRNAGHMAPQDAPGPTRALVTRWTHGKPLTCDQGIFGNLCLLRIKQNNENSQYVLV